jgi:hypothetical protein
LVWCAGSEARRVNISNTLLASFRILSREPRVVNFCPREWKEVNMQRVFYLPFGYRATFRWRPEAGFEVRWSPDRPFLHKPRAQRRFFAAYQAARRSFFEDVAAVVGGKVLVIDSPGFQNFDRTEVISAPTRH